MSFNFDSGQFNKESTPKRLGNWQVPRWAPTRARPLEYRPNPKPICDENGHFLPGAPRGSSRCFGHYTGTWELPRKITRKVADELAKEPPDGRFPDWLHLRVQRPKVVARLRGRKEKKDPPPDEQSFKKAVKQAGEYNEEPPLDENKFSEEDWRDIAGDHLYRGEEGLPTQGDQQGPYEPGQLTSPEHRHEAPELGERRRRDRADRFWGEVAQRAADADADDDPPDMRCKKKSNTPKLPAVNVTQNFQFAKKMHVGNLEHQPLPDTLGYRNLSKIGEHRDSDIIVKPYAIGWKGYGAAGPTCCTKMRVHRPKTCDPKKADSEPSGDARPCSSAPDLGGQYKKPMSLMDLAICWDFRPDNPKVEPRPPKHIDGSNGSKAPAVFTMVHTPKEETEPLTIVHTIPIFNQNQIAQDPGHHPVPYFEKDMSKEKRKESCDVQYCSQHSSGRDKAKPRNGTSRQNGTKQPCDGIHGCGTPTESSRRSGHVGGGERARPDKLQPIKQAWNADTEKQTKDAIKTGNPARNSIESYDKTPLAQGKLHQSSPNESQLSRRSTKDSISSNNNSTKHKSCMPCNGSRTSPDGEKKEDYKFAFKAGNPNSVQSSSSSGSKDSKGFKIPKMRHPYTKKSYTIPTLSPPFTIWKDANATGYPEHWRLASVYQHAYKPPEQRRKPLIDSVYQ